MSRLPELTAKVDAFFARVTVRHGDDMQCTTGCSDCCHVRLSVTGVEAAAIRELVASWPAAQRAELAEQGPPDRCSALDPATGRCRIYAARPLVCRSHGVPIRLIPPGRNSLPVIEACHRNFRHSEADADCVLDQGTLSALLLAVNGGDTTRIDLAALLAEC